MILKVCIRCLKKIDFIERYNIQNIASCPANGTCQYCKLDLISTSLRWVAATEVPKGAVTCFPPPAEKTARPSNARPLPTLPLLSEVPGEHVTDELSFFFGGSKLPLPSMN